MSLFRNNKSGVKHTAKNADTYIGKYKIGDTVLSVIMLVTVAAALVASVLCIFVIGNRLSDKGVPSDSTDSSYFSDSESESRAEPNGSNTDRPIESGTNGVNGDSSDDSEFPETSDTGSDETDTSITTDLSTDKDADTGTDEPTETETDKHHSGKDEPVGYVPTTPDDVSVIGYYDMQSKNAILIDCGTNTSIAQRLADQVIYPASLTKIMTVVVAYENINNFNETFVMPIELWRKAVNQGASKAKFYTGTVLTMTDLMYGTILPSGAEAAYGLAQCVAGSEEAFAVLMNKKAAELGMSSTHFVNVTGLHDPNHYSTVRDMATLMNYAMSIPAVKEILSAITYRRSDGQQELTSIVFNITESVHKTYNNGVTMIAGKSGYTPEAGNCLATYYESDNGKSYILVTAGASNGKYAPVNDAAVLIEKYIK